MNTELVKQGDITNPEADLDISHLKSRKQRRFLQALMFTGGNIKKACEYAEVDLSFPWKVKAINETFAKLFAIQLERSTALLESEAISRAIDGEWEDVFYEGTVVGQRLKKSDRLLEVLLKARKPEYKEGFTQNVGIWGEGSDKLTINFQIPRPPKE